MKVPFLDLKRQYITIKEEIDSSIEKVVNSQSFILGEFVETFENRIAKYCGVKNAVGVASGTDAILLSLRALDISGKVLTSPFTFFATAGSINNAGAVPKFVDIDHDTYNLDHNLLRKSMDQNDKISAVLPIHLFGQSAEMEPINEIAEERGLFVIEDGAQSIGAEYNGKKIGSENIVCFSFFPSKNLGGFGDGGMITTNDDMLADKIRTLRVHGSKPKYYHQVIGYNSRLDAIQAAVLDIKLNYLDKWTNERIKNAKFYNKHLKDLDGLKTPKTVKNRKHVFNQYTIQVKNNLRYSLKEFLQNNGVGTAIYYPLPLHLQPCFSFLKYSKGDFIISENACSEVLSLPIFPELAKGELEYVVDKILEFFDQNQNVY